jgi:5'-nucleotidase
LLNVNLPAGPVRGLRPTTLGHRIYRDQVSVRKDLRGRDYYWIGGPEEKGPDIPGSDCTAIAQGLVSVTAIGLDLTHRPTVDRLAAWWPGDRFGR